MNYVIKKASILLGTGEECYSEFDKINVFIGNNSHVAIRALAEVACALPFESNETMRIVNLVVECNKKMYDVSSVSTVCGSKALVKYDGERNGVNKTAFIEYQRLLEECCLMGDVNIFDNRKKTAMDENLTQETITKLNLDEFFSLINSPPFIEDKRPIFMWNISNNDLMKIIEELSGMNRQIFIAIEEDYIADYPSFNKVIVEKINHTIDT